MPRMAAVEDPEKAKELLGVKKSRYCPISHRRVTHLHEQLLTAHPSSLLSRVLHGNIVTQNGVLLQDTSCDLLKSCEGHYRNNFVLTSC